jgi:preprotein translocase subunit YajC
MKPGDKVIVFGLYPGVVKKVDKHGIQVKWKVNGVDYLAYVKKEELK